MLLLSIPLRLLLATQPKQVTLVLKVAHRMNTKRVGLSLVGADDESSDTPGLR